MSEIKSIERDPLYVVSPSIISQKSKRTGVILVRSTFILMITIGLIQGLYSFEKIDFGFFKLETLTICIYSLGYCYRLLKSFNLW